MRTQSMAMVTCASVLAVGSLTGCVPAPDSDTDIDSEIRSTATRGAPPERPHAVLDSAQTPLLAAAWSAPGDLVLFDTATGAIVSQVPGAVLGGEVDLACDPWWSRILLFEGDPEEQWGEIASHPIVDDGG